MPHPHVKNLPGDAAGDPYADTAHLAAKEGLELPPRGSRWSPRNWSRRTWTFVLVGLVTVTALTAGTVAGVLHMKANRYPDYTPLKYELKDTHTGQSFFDQFNYHAGRDGPKSMVKFVNATDAKALDLTSTTSTSAMLRIDNSPMGMSATNKPSNAKSEVKGEAKAEAEGGHHKQFKHATSAGNSTRNFRHATSTGNSTENTDNGGNGDQGQHHRKAHRKSVQIISKKQYNSGLFIFDIKHTPVGCGASPSLTLADPENMRDNGQIHLMQRAKKGDGVITDIQTHGKCLMDVKRKVTGMAMQTNCTTKRHHHHHHHHPDQAQNGTDSQMDEGEHNSNATMDHDKWNGMGDKGKNQHHLPHKGCEVRGDNSTFGDGFNKNGGGVYALEFRSAGIRSWIFSRADIPADIMSGKPDPSKWSTPFADFPSTHCDISKNFQNQSVMIDIGMGWPGADMHTNQTGCPATMADVLMGGQGLDEAYWEFNSFKVYQTK